LKPIHEMARVVIVWPERGWLWRSRSRQDCCSVAGRPGQRCLLIYRTRVPGIEFLPSAFLSGDEERCALSTVVFDRPVPSKNARKAPVTVSEARLIGVQKPNGTGHSRDAGIGILPAIVPDKDAPVCDHTGGMGRACPKMNHVRSVAEP